MKTAPRKNPAQSSWPYGFKVEITDGTSRLIDISEGLLELYGYSREDLSGPEAWRILVPDEAEVVEESMAQVLSGRGWDGRLRARTKDGRQLVIEATAELERRTDGRTIIHGRVRDVTEQVILERKLRESETRLQVLNETFRMVMWSCDPELHFTFSWGSGLADLGLQENELVGMTLHEYLGTDEPAFPAIAAHRRALEGEHVAYELKWKGRHYRCWVEPHIDSTGEVLGIIGLALDITAQRWVEQETKEIGRELGAPRIAAEAAWSAPDDEIIEVGDLRIDVGAFEVRRAGRPIRLTPTEFRLLVELARRPGRVVTRDTLLGRVWGHGFLGGGSLITMAILRLRAKIERDPAHPELIETVRGIGYRMRPR